MTVDKIIIHCADTPEGMDIGVSEIRDWHLERGWSDVGYHFVIRLDGKIERGRNLDTPGAHARGYNMNSIGICYVGGKDDKDTRTAEQLKSLDYLIQTLRLIYPGAKVLGHRDLPGVKKYCPSFYAIKEYEE